MTGALSAYVTNQSAKEIALAGLFGAAAGAITGANTSSALALGVVNGLAEAVNELVSSIPCGKLGLNPAAIGAAAFAGVLGGEGSALLGGLESIAQHPAVLQELIRSLPGVGASGVMLPATAIGDAVYGREQ